jgi:hypothetical protein
MHCRRCPHLVRHGQLADDKQTIEFKNLCGLVIKQQLQKEQGIDAANQGKKPSKKVVKKNEEVHLDSIKQHECQYFPFPKFFDYIDCETYQSTFKSSSRKNDVVPTRDFQYSDALTGSSITDMELL